MFHRGLSDMLGEVSLEEAHYVWKVSVRVSILSRLQDIIWL